MRTAALLLIVAAVVLVAAGLEAASPDSGAANEMIIPVQGFRFDGHSAFSSETLAEAVADFAGRGLTFAELEEAAGRITRLYRARGFIVAEAYIPAQVIEADGIVTIAVREGRYGDVVVRNESRLADDVARAALGRVKPGALIEAAPLERVLSLLDELPGVSARGELSSGGEPGTSILTVRLADAGRFAGSLRVDNYGHELTGRARTSFSADVNNVSGYGDRLSVQATAAEGLGHGSLAYSVPLNATPFRLSIGLTASRYVMGGALAELGVEGTTSVWRLGMNYPLKRVAPRPGAAGVFVHRIDGDVAFESRALQDRVGALSGNERRKPCRPGYGEAATPGEGRWSSASRRRGGGCTSRTTWSGS